MMSPSFLFHKFSPGSMGFLRLGVTFVCLMILPFCEAHASEVPLLAAETGISLDTPLEIGGGRFRISAPVIVNADIYTPVKPEVEVVDDHNLRLKYPNGASVQVALADSQATISFSGMPREATAVSMKMVIHREAYQGSRFVIDKREEEAFPEEDERRELFAGKASTFTLMDHAGNRLAIRSPDLRLRLENKGPEGWSHYACSWSFVLADHPGQSSFILDFSLKAGE